MKLFTFLVGFLSGLAFVFGPSFVKPFGYATEKLSTVLAGIGIGNPLVIIAVFEVLFFVFYALVLFWVTGRKLTKGEILVQLALFFAGVLMMLVLWVVAVMKSVSSANFIL